MKSNLKTETVMDAMFAHLSGQGSKKLHLVTKSNIEDKMASDGAKTCIVCGEESHRTSWDKQTKDGQFVACDHHSDKEFADAVKAATPAAQK